MRNHTMEKLLFPIGIASKRSVFWLYARRARIRLALSARHGFGTLEVVIIIAVFLTVALIFRETLLAFANKLIDTVFKSDSVIKDLAIDGTH
jgi:hypothetical protein